MIWAQFESLAPELASKGKDRLRALALLGTIRKDGVPRISPVEPFITEGHLLLGIMRSQKVLDLIRDPRCVVQNVVSDPQGSQGEFKLRGKAVQVKEHGLREAYMNAYSKTWGRNPPEPFPSSVFSIDIEHAVLIDWNTSNGEMVVTSWRPPQRIEKSRRKYP